MPNPRDTLVRRPGNKQFMLSRNQDAKGGRAGMQFTQGDEIGKMVAGFFTNENIYLNF